MSDFIDIRDFEEMAKYFEEGAYWTELAAANPMDPEEEAHYNEIMGYTPEEESEPRPAHLLLVGATTMMNDCRVKGHLKLIDRSTAGPDSGDMDHECLHCGAYFHVPLY